jgi:hypothetical protein
MLPCCHVAIAPVVKGPQAEPVRHGAVATRLRGGRAKEASVLDLQVL